MKMEAGSKECRPILQFRIFQAPSSVRNVIHLSCPARLLHTWRMSEIVSFTLPTHGRPSFGLKDGIAVPEGFRVTHNEIILLPIIPDLFSSSCRLVTEYTDLGLLLQQYQILIILVSRRNT